MVVDLFELYYLVLWQVLLLYHLIPSFLFALSISAWEASKRYPFSSRAMVYFLLYMNAQIMLESQKVNVLPNASITAVEISPRKNAGIGPKKSVVQLKP